MTTAPGDAPPARDPEEDGKGLLLVDFLSLGRMFSFQRYRDDIVGFLVAWGIVAVLVALGMWVARLGG